MGGYDRLIHFFNFEGDQALAFTFILNLFVACACAALFMIFLSLDVWTAFKRKAYWFPGQALVLSAPIIQLLSFLGKLNLSADSGNIDDKCLQQALLLEDEQIIIRSRIMICVLIGYLLPGIVRSSFTNFESNIRALTLTIIIHLMSEVYFFQNVNVQELVACHSPSPSPGFEVVSPSPSSAQVDSHFSFWKFYYHKWFLESSATLSTFIVLLVFLLTCAVLAGKSISNIISRKVPLALSCCCNSAEGHKLQCHSIGDHILKSWIVVRASQPDYIIARSVFSSFVGLVVTVCIVLFVVDCRILGIVLIPDGIQLVFILTGWIIILLRWLIGVMYFSRSLRSLFYWEDFWTRNIVELKADLSAHCRERLFREKRLSKKAIQARHIVRIIRIRLYFLLLTMALCLQKLMVLLSKACWCLSEIVFRMIRPVLLSREKNVLLSGFNISPTHKNPFFKYKEALEIIRMPGEIAYSLWIANESAFKNVEKHMEEGFKKGRDSSQLIKLKEHRTGDPHDEAAISVEEEQYFQQVGKKSWKMKAVSLIRFMVFYYEDAVSTDIDDAIQAYCQAWPLMDIVDSSNPEANLVSEAADKEFNALEDIWKKHLQMKSVENPKYSHLKEHLFKLKEEEIKKGNLCQLDKEGDLKLFSDEEEAKAIKDENYKDRFHDSKDWMRSASTKSSLYKTRKALDLDRDHSMARLKSLLANVIFGCIDVEIDKALINNCNIWARERNENDIFEAAFLCGIADAVKIGERQSKVEAVIGQGTQVGSLPDAINEV